MNIRIVQFPNDCKKEITKQRDYKMDCTLSPSFMHGHLAQHVVHYVSPLAYHRSELDIDNV